MLTRMLNGEVIPLSPDEEAALLAEWADAVPSFDFYKAAKLRVVNDAFQLATAALTAGYPPDEKDSWPNQTNEATAWCVDNSVPTPYIDDIALYRGIGRELFLQKTASKVLSYKRASAFLVGTRQRYADQIANAQTVEDLDAIVPDFTLPSSS